MDLNPADTIVLKGSHSDAAVGSAEMSWNRKKGRPTAIVVQRCWKGLAKHLKSAETGYAEIDLDVEDLQLSQFAVQSIGPGEVGADLGSRSPDPGIGLSGFDRIDLVVRAYAASLAWFHPDRTECCYSLANYAGAAALEILACSVSAAFVGKNSCSVRSNLVGWHDSTAGGESTGAHARLIPVAPVAAIVASEG
jgi:hypothetical protein